jgi:hypothetical protein
MSDDIDIKQGLKTILWCLITMCILGAIIMFIDPKLNQHMYMFFFPFIVAIVSAVGVIMIYFKIKKDNKVR